MLTTLVYTGLLLSSSVTQDFRLSHTSPSQHGKALIVRNSTELRYHINATILPALSSIGQWYNIQIKGTTVKLTLKITTSSSLELFSSPPACPSARVIDFDSTRIPQTIEIEQCNVPGTTCLSTTRQPSCAEIRKCIRTYKFLGFTSNGARIYQRNSFNATIGCTCRI